MEPEQSFSTGQEPEAPPSPGGCSWRVALLILAIGIAFGMGSWFSRRNMAVDDFPTLAASSATVEKPVIVQISGAVKKPGVYELPFNSRIYQAIKKAGGSLADADLDSINLADWVEDGSQIIVPSKKSLPIADASAPSADLPPLSLDADSPSSAPLESTFRADQKSSIKTDSPKQPQSTFKEPPKSPIDLNRATAEDLQQLPGVGPAMAERILQYRKENQGFTSIDDLDNVRGIGPKKLEKIKPFVIVKPLPFQKSAQ
jgi:competence protein ComEA